MKYLFTLLFLITFDIAVIASDEKSQVPLADPYILVDGGRYYAYGTHSDLGIEVFVSSDLKTWYRNGLALGYGNTTESKWFWAPEVYKFGDIYYMYYSANEHLYVATAKSPLGPFKQLGSRVMQKVLGDEKCIDSSVFTDEDGTQYIFFVRFNDGNCIWMCRLGSDHVTPDGSTLRKCINVSQSWEQKWGRVNEGPFVVKSPNNYYILSYSANDYQSQDYGVGCAVTANLSTGTWVKYSENPIVHRVENLVGCGHHSFFTDNEGKMRIVFHAHNSVSAIHPRMMYIGTMEYDSKNGHLRLSSDSIVRPVLTSKPTAISYLGDSQQRCVKSMTTVSGCPAVAGQKGIIIVRYSDGTVEKKIVH
jgi:beta-xylosidase